MTSLKTVPIVLAIFALLAGCAEVGLQRIYDEQTGFTYTNVKSASDLAGGPRQDLIVTTDKSGQIRAAFNASGPGVWQTMTEGLAGSAMMAGGMMGAAALLRPSNT